MAEPRHDVPTDAIGPTPYEEVYAALEAQAMPDDAESVTFPKNDPTDPNNWADHLLWLASELRANDRDVEFVWLAQDGVAPSWTLADQLELAARNLRASVGQPIRPPLTRCEHGVSPLEAICAYCAQDAADPVRPCESEACPGKPHSWVGQFGEPESASRTCQTFLCEGCSGSGVSPCRHLRVDEGDAGGWYCKDCGEDVTSDVAGSNPAPDAAPGDDATGSREGQVAPGRAAPSGATPGRLPLTEEQRDESYRMAVDAAYALGYKAGYDEGESGWKAMWQQYQKDHPHDLYHAAYDAHGRPPESTGSAPPGSLSARPCRKCRTLIADPLNLLDGYCKLCFVWLHPSKSEQEEALGAALDKLIGDES